MKKTICTMCMLGMFLFASTSVLAETITLATGEWPPFMGKDIDGHGLHSKMLKTVFAEMGHEVDIKFMPWKRVYELTKKGDYVAAFSWLKTPARQKEMLFPENELALSREVGFYKKSKFPNGLAIKSIDDIKKQNLKVVGISAYWYEEPIKAKGIKANFVSNADLAWKMMAGGRGDLMIANANVGTMESQSFLGQGKDKEFGMTAPIKIQPLYVIFSKNHPRGKELIQAYDAAISRLKAAGAL